MKKFLSIGILVILAMVSASTGVVYAAGGGKCVFDQTISAVVEPIEVSSDRISATQIRPGGEITMIYTIRNHSSQRHYYVSCNIEVPPFCFMGAKWADTGEYYAPGTEFEVPSQCYRTLEVTVSPNLTCEEEFPIRAQFFRTYSIDGNG